ncbi:hypothetical protein RI103_37440 (plasmid) [Paraburkholderia sp. FT54]|jgi:hypothetical protein|nr:hypothetical protein [Paraburkholderia sp. FT54]WNC95414.1 hypothetical protein RI103_37440 [Paraburkholderia sp. FT54]
MTGILEAGLACRSIRQKVSPSTRGMRQPVTTLSGGRLLASSNATKPSSAVVTWMLPGLKQKPCFDDLRLVVHQRCPVYEPLQLEQLLHRAHAPCLGRSPIARQ